MRAVVQRVTHASIRVEAETVGEIGKGLVVLLGVARDDTEKDAEYLAEKIASLRVFDDSEGRMNLSVKDVRWRAVGGFAVHTLRRRAAGLASFMD